MLLVSLGLTLPVATAQDVEVTGDRNTYFGDLQNGEFDAYRLPSGDGKVLTYIVEPNFTYTKFDIYIFDTRQYARYQAGDSLPGFQKTNQGVWRQEDQFEDFQEGWILVVDNTNITAKGASSSGTLNYEIEIEIESKPFYQRYWWALTGIGILALVIIIIGVIMMNRSSTTPASTPVHGHIGGSSSLPPPTTSIPPPPGPPAPPGPRAGFGGPGSMPPPPPPPVGMSKPPSTPYGSPSPSPPPPSPSSPPPPPATGMAAKTLLVECPRCEARIEYDPVASQGRITCDACGLSGKVD